MRVSLLLLALGPLAAEAGLRTGKLKRGRHISDFDSETSGTMASMYPFYHSTEQIRARLGELANKCEGMTVQSVDKSGAEGDDRSIDVVTIRKPGSQPVNKNFFLFGEHARELISPESGLHFIESLCGEHGPLKDQAEEVLKNNEFQIVVNGNPSSRAKVEQGDFCLRVNPNGVDLNRNWDEEWQQAPPMDPVDTNPGNAPFSESETRVFKELTQQYMPSTFLTIHSGTRGMYMPWAYDMEHLAKRNQPEMMEILRKVDQDHCQCPFGAAGKEVGYPCPGTCLDWVYDKLNTSYSFAFEIYTAHEADEDLKERWQEKMGSGPGAFLQTHSHLAHEHFRDIFEKNPSDFVQLSSHRHKSHRRGNGMSAAECFTQFNPETQDDFDSVRNNWSKAYLDLATLVATNLAGSSGGAAAAPKVQAAPSAQATASLASTMSWLNSA